MPKSCNEKETDNMPKNNSLIPRDLGNDISQADMITPDRRVSKELQYKICTSPYARFMLKDHEDFLLNINSRKYLYYYRDHDPYQPLFDGYSEHWGCPIFVAKCRDQTRNDVSIYVERATTLLDIIKRNTKFPDIAQREQREFLEKAKKIPDAFGELVVPVGVCDERVIRYYIKKSFNYKDVDDLVHLTYNLLKSRRFTMTFNLFEDESNYELVTHWNQCEEDFYKAALRAYGKEVEIENLNDYM